MLIRCIISVVIQLVHKQFETKIIDSTVSFIVLD